MRLLKTGLILIFLLFTILSIFSADEGWITLQQGIASFNNRDFGKALTFFKTSLDQTGVLPEAEYWIGRIFEQEGEYRLALEQYRTAASYSAFLYVPDELYTILYRTARIHEVLREYYSYEETLREITSIESIFTVAPEIKTAMVNSLQNRGVDRFLTLYRNYDKPKVKAYGDLGVFYVKTGRYYQAVENLLFAVTIPLSVSIEYLKGKDPDYEFYGIDILLEEISKVPALREYLREEQFFKYWYYLGSSFFASGERERSREIWTYLSRQNLESEYRILARRQLTAPFLEPLIILN